MPATYRFEVAKQGRAGCQSAACKNEGLKIDKGELRMGSLVEMRDYTSWKWKHWGCVTPLQIGNILEQLGGLDGLDIDNDLDILDGYDEIPQWAQNKIKYALQNEHVEDADWKGDPELNRPGMKGLHKRTPKKKASADDETEDDGVTEMKPRKGRGKKKLKDEEGVEQNSPVPKKAASRKRKKSPTQEDEDLAPVEKPKRKQRAKKVKVEEGEDEVSDNRPLRKPKSVQKSKKVKTEDAEEAPTQITASTNGTVEALVTTTGRGRKPKGLVAKPVNGSGSKLGVKKEVSDAEALETTSPVTQMAISTKTTAKTSRGRGRPPKVKQEAEETEHAPPKETNGDDDEDEDIVDMKTKQTKMAKAKSRKKIR